MAELVKIRAIQSASGPEITIAAGGFYEFEEEIAFDLVRAGFAVYIGKETREDKAANKRETVTAGHITPPRPKK